MKKLIAVTLAVTMVLGLIAAISLFAKSLTPGGRAVFESDIVDAYIESGDELDKGEFWIREDGSFKVEIEGENLVDGDEYTANLHDVWFGVGLTELGTFTIMDGEGVLTGNLYDMGIDIEDEYISPAVVIEDDGASWQFITGCYAPLPPP
jgi:hypothetical protein